MTSSPSPPRRQTLRPVWENDDRGSCRSLPVSKSLSLWERCHCEAMTERASPARKSIYTAISCAFVQPLSLAFARQLPWQGSPWQRGSVFDETDWGLLENVTECQSLSLWERWHCEAMTERARMLTKSKKTQRYKPCLSETSYRNAAGVISPGLPSQALARQLSQRESPWQRGFVFDETDLRLLENVTECQSLPY